MNLNRKTFSFFIMCLVAILPLTSSSTVASIAVDKELEALYHNVPFDMPKVELPNIPNYQVSIEKFGGVGDGITDNSKAFNDAINHLAKKGGGRLIIPKGIWLTGPIKLQSYIELHVERGALIKFDANKDLYPLIKTSFEGLDAWRSISPIYGKNLTDIAITGKGIIDGSGGEWRLVKKYKLTVSQWKKLTASGGVVSKNGKLWFPSEQSQLGHDIQKGHYTDKDNKIFLYNKEQANNIKHWLRPVMVALVNSNRILLDGPTFQNSPAWNLHMLMSKNIVLRNLVIRNPWFSQNGDGLDLESVKNVLVYNNSFDVGDDAICIKSGRNEDGRNRGMPSENLIIKNNVVYHAHGGLVLGSEMSGGVKNVLFSNATFIGTDIGIRFKSTRGRGGVVENIWISDIDMFDIVKSAINFNLYYSNNETWNPKSRGANQLPKVDETTPSFKNISINNVRAINVGTAAFLQGLPEMKLSNVEIKNSYFKSKKGIQITDADGIKFNNVTLHTEEENSLLLRNVQNVNFEQFEIGNNHHVKVEGSDNKNIVFSKKNVDVKVGEYVKKGTVSFKQ
ncbi:MAG: glycoside hydrolase family 28 protein [Colwellia sp.]|nr:glycoside hydrolase family 28 protein [Colwellia sp.]